MLPIAGPWFLLDALDHHVDPTVCLDLTVNEPTPSRLSQLAEASAALLRTSGADADDVPIAVTLQPVVETIKLLDDGGFVAGTIARESLRQLHYPVLCATSRLQEALRRLGASATPETLIAVLRATANRIVDLASVR